MSPALLILAAGAPGTYCDGTVLTMPRALVRSAHAAAHGAPRAARSAELFSTARCEQRKGALNCTYHFRPSADAAWQVQHAQFARQADGGWTLIPQTQPK